MQLWDGTTNPNYSIDRGPGTTNPGRVSRSFIHVLVNRGGRYIYIELTGPKVAYIYNCEAYLDPYDDMGAAPLSPYRLYIYPILSHLIYDRQVSRSIPADRTCMPRKRSPHPRSGSIQHHIHLFVLDGSRLRIRTPLPKKRKPPIDLIEYHLVGVGLSSSSS